MEHQYNTYTKGHSLARTYLEVVFALRCHFAHSVGHFLFPRQSKRKEGWHDCYRRSALTVGKFSKGRILHGKPQAGQRGNEHEGTVDHTIVKGRRRDFVASVFGRQRRHYCFVVFFTISESEKIVSVLIQFYSFILIDFRMQKSTDDCY